MPKELEDKLKKEAEKKFPGDKPRQDHYVYGGIENIKKKQRRRKRRRK